MSKPFVFRIDRVTRRSRRPETVKVYTSVGWVSTFLRRQPRPTIAKLQVSVIDVATGKLGMYYDFGRRQTVVCCYSAHEWLTGYASPDPDSKPKTLPQTFRWFILLRQRGADLPVP